MRITACIVRVALFKLVAYFFLFSCGFRLQLYIQKFNKTVFHFLLFAESTILFKMYESIMHKCNKWRILQDIQRVNTVRYPNFLINIISRNKSFRHGKIN